MTDIATAMPPKPNPAALRERLGLKLSPLRIDALLVAFQAAKREPSEQELRTLDALLYGAVMEPRASSLSSFQTEDPDTAATFSDLIEKSKDIRGKAPLPTPAIALRVASDMLSRKGITPPAPRGATGERLLMISHKEYPLLPLYGLRPIESISLGNTWRIVKAVSAEPWFVFPSANGELCSLILPPDGEDAYDRILAFFSRKEIQTPIRFLCAVHRETYLQTLLARANGYDVDLSALPGLSDLSPAEAAERLPFGYLVCADQASTRYLMEEAQASGLTMAAFACVNESFALTFSTHGAVEFSFPTPQLRNLAQPRSIQIRTANQGDRQKQEHTILHGRIGTDTMAYCTLALDTTLTPSDVLSAFEQTLNTLTEHGGDRRTAYAIVGLGEHAEVAPSGLWSAVLGLHRATCEQRIPSYHPIFTHTEQGELTLCLIAKASTAYNGEVCSPEPFAPTEKEQVEGTEEDSTANLPDQTAENP